MVRQRITLFALVSALTAVGAGAQTVTWGGGFPDDNFLTQTDWIGDTLPLNNGTETLAFNGGSDNSLILNTDASFVGLALSAANNNGAYVDISTANGSTLTVGASGIALTTDDSSTNTLILDVDTTLTSNQVWGQLLNTGGGIWNFGDIGGAYKITLQGDSGGNEVFGFISGTSTFSGGLYVKGGPPGSAYDSVVVVGASTTPTSGAVTSGPLGTGTVRLGDSSTLTTNSAANVTLGNTLIIGDNANGIPVTLGGEANGNGFNPPNTSLTFTGATTLFDLNQTLDIAQDTSVAFTGSITGHNVGTSLNVGSTGYYNQIVIFQGTFSNVSLIDTQQNATVILDGASPAQIAGLTALESSATTYVGLGRGYSGAGDVTSFLGFMNAGSSASFQGTLGFDTTSGSTVVFSDPVDLSSFTEAGFAGIGSATTAILSPSAVYTPPGNTFLFGGGGGTLTVQSPLADGSQARNLALSSFDNDPLTVVLSGTLTYTGGTQAKGGALIFDAPLPPTGSLIVGGGGPSTPGYIGSTVNSGYTDANLNIQGFINLFQGSSSFGVIGFDALTGNRAVTSNIDLSNLSAGVYLGTATSVTYSGTITPYNNTYQFAGVKGGQVTVSSTLSGSDSVVIGLENTIEGMNLNLGFVTDSAVFLTAANYYSGGTTLNSGYLYVTNFNSIGTGPLVVPSTTTYLRGNQWVATLATATGPVLLSNPIQVPDNGLALNTGSNQTLTLTGTISAYGSQSGQIGIFGPVELDGNNTYGSTSAYSAGTYIASQGFTVTLGSNTALGVGEVQAIGSTLHFTSGNPIIPNGFYLNDTQVTFDGTPEIADLSMAYGSTINFNGTNAIVTGFEGDQPNSGDSINLATGTTLVIDTDNPVGNSGGGTFYGTITGPGGTLVVTGTGGNSLDLRGDNTYGGGTTLTSGVIVIASNNSALGTGPVTIDDGALVTNTGITLTNPITLNGSVSGVAGLAGFGTFSPGGTIAFQNYAGVDPGRANIGSGNNTNLAIPIPGKLSFGSGTNISFGSNGEYLFSMTDANGAAGTGYSTISLPGTLSITNSGNPFQIELYTFDPSSNQPGNALNFTATGSYQWTLVSAGSITGFNASYFAIDATNFTNALGGGTFSVSQSGSDLLLNFTPVPEPSTWALIAGGLCVLAAAVRRRRRAA